MFKIGIGPSSSHTLGPWRAAERFLQSLDKNNMLADITSIQILLYGSLAKTGRGHGTDTAILLGLSGDDPVSFDVNNIHAKINDISSRKKLLLNGKYEINFDPTADISFLFTETLPYHPNALTFLATAKNDRQLAETYYSIGGGFVKKENEEEQPGGAIQLPFPVNTADDLLHWCMQGLSISEVVMENESA